MSEEYRFQGDIDGVHRNIRIKTAVDRPTVERIIGLSEVPSGGIYVIQHIPVNEEGGDFYREARERNPGMRGYVGYTMFETDRIPASWVTSCNQMDEIWVPTHFNLETFAKAGVARAKLHVVSVGIEPSYYRPAETKPLDVGEKKGFTFLSIFEWTFRKGWDVLLKAYLEEFGPDEDVRLVIRAYQGYGVLGDHAPPVREQLDSTIAHLGYEPDRIPSIDFLDEMIPDREMPGLYKAADAFILPTRGEGWGIPFTESMLMEVPVIATRWSGHLEFMNDENSYLIDVDRIAPVGQEQVRDNPLYTGHKWAEPSVTHTRELMRRVFENREDAAVKGKRAREHIIDKFTVRHTALKVARRLATMEECRKARGQKSHSERPNARKNGPRGNPGSPGRKLMKVLFQGRSNIFTSPGGDTEVLVHLRTRLEDRGMVVDFCDRSRVDLSGYDLVHIFNLEPEFSVNAALKGVPYFVTPLHEDKPRYFARSMETASLFREYMTHGDAGDFDEKLKSLGSMANLSQPTEFEFVASHADAMFATGESEKARLKKDFPGSGPIEVVRLGFNRPEGAGAVSADLFASAYGVADFVLCVGRLDTRKNQLMLLYALKDADVPVVFVNSETPQPEYEELCRRFERRGRTIFTGRISREMLFSAYRAARVHALPSWIELPGLVSLEAAWFGCHVVASRWGTLGDYLGDQAFYCEPDDPASLRETVMAAMEAPPALSVSESLEELTWEATVEHVCKAYDRFLLRSGTDKGVRKAKRRGGFAKKELLFNQLRDKAESALQRNPAEALEITSNLAQVKPFDPVTHFIKGAASLSLMDYEAAERNLRKTIDLKPDFATKGYLFLALLLLKQKRFAEAVDVLSTLYRRNPFLQDETKYLVLEYLRLGYSGLGDRKHMAEIGETMSHLRPDDIVHKRFDHGREM